MKRFQEWLFGPVPQSLMARMTRRPKPGLDRLYVLYVDFRMSPDVRLAMNESLDPIKSRYGIDVIVLEPGMKFARFDDI